MPNCLFFSEMLRLISKFWNCHLYPVIITFLIKISLKGFGNHKWLLPKSTLLGAPEL